MAQKPRLHFPGAPRHVPLHGNACDDIFFADEDHGRFCFFLQEALERSRRGAVARDATSLRSAARRVAERAKEADALQHTIERLRHDFEALQA
jgi:hypothetical protein